MKPLVRMITQAIGGMPLRSRVACMHLVADVGSVRRIARSAAADTAKDVAILSSCSKKSMTHPKKQDITDSDEHVNEPQRIDTLLVRPAAYGMTSPATGGADIAAEHWNVLFNAVIERLEAAAGEEVEAQHGAHLLVEIDGLRRIVLECVEALRRLNAAPRG